MTSRFHARGDEHRLEPVYPWSMEDIDAIASNALSPFDLTVVSEQQRIKYISGGIIRMLLCAGLY